MRVVIAYDGSESADEARDLVAAIDDQIDRPAAAVVGQQQFLPSGRRAPFSEFFAQVVFDYHRFLPWF